MTAPTTTQATLDQAAWWLALASLPFALFALRSPVPVHFVKVTGAALLVLLVLCALAAVGARTGRGVLVLAAAVGLLIAAVVQLAQTGRGTNWLGGDGSTYSVFLGFGVGLLALGLARRTLTALHHAQDAAIRPTDPKDVP